MPLFSQPSPYFSSLNHEVAKNSMNTSIFSICWQPTDAFLKKFFFLECDCIFIHMNVDCILFMDEIAFFFHGTFYQICGSSKIDHQQCSVNFKVFQGQEL